MIIRKTALWCITAVLAAGMAGAWYWRAAENFYADTDFGRDLNELANLYQGHMVWLGPRLSINYHASPIYYYEFLPGLWLTGGNVKSVFVTNVVIGLTAWGIYGWVMKQKLGWKKATIALILVGLTPMWWQIIRHPGNGFVYMFWLWGAMAVMWSEGPMWLQAILLGIAIAIHPLAGIGLPLLGFNWWRKGRSLKELAVIGLWLMVPWIPIMGFEIITKGYLLREWVNGSHVLIRGIISWDNLVTAAKNIGIVPLELITGISLAIGWSKQGKERLWLIWGSSMLGLGMLVGNVPPHYLWGISALLLFTLIMAALKSVKGEILAGGWLMVMMFGLGGQSGAVKARPIDRVQATAEAIMQSGKVRPDQSINIVNILAPDAKSPAGDDYRFFFKMNGYRVEDVFAYRKSQQLIIIAEIENFDWKSWRSWEMEEFTREPYKPMWEEQINDRQVTILAR